MKKMILCFLISVLFIALIGNNESLATLAVDGGSWVEWKDKNTIIISETAGEERVNEPVEVNLKLDGAKNDGSDIRIIDSNETEMPYQVVDFDGNGTFILAFFANVPSLSTNKYYILSNNSIAEKPNYDTMNYVLNNETKSWQTDGVQIEWGGLAYYGTANTNTITTLKFDNNGDQNPVNDLDTISDDKNDGWPWNQLYGYLGASKHGVTGFGSSEAQVSANGPIFIELTLGTAKIRYYKGHNNWIMANNYVRSLYSFNRNFLFMKNGYYGEINIQNAPFSNFVQGNWYVNDNPKYLAFRDPTSKLILGGIASGVDQWQMEAKKWGSHDRLIDFSVDYVPNPEKAKIYWYADTSNGYVGIEKFSKKILNPLQIEIVKDAIAPLTRIILSGTIGQNNWYTSDVQGTLTAIDNEGGLGVAKTEYSYDGINWTTYTAPFTISTDTTVYYRSTDKAGNVESTKEQLIKIDKTPPIISGAATTSPNANGWYNNDVTVQFNASDTISGIATVTPDITISTEGPGQSVTGTATDQAGNSASFSVTGINIDKTPPDVTINTPADGKEYILNQNVIADWLADDALSGLASASGTVAAGQAIDTSTAGTKTFTVVATDNAGNEITKTVTYHVGYAFGGILPPVKADGSSVIKQGSAVPVKFQLEDANGSLVTGATARLYVAKVDNGTVGEELEAVSTSAAATGNLFRYDSTDNQYIFNLSTKGLSSGTWQLRIELDDGTSKYAVISLK